MQGDTQFRRYWIADASYATAGTIGVIGLQLVGVVDLGLDPGRISVVVAAQEFAWLVVGLPAAVLVDRIRRKFHVFGAIGWCTAAMVIVLALVAGSDHLSFSVLVGAAAVFSCLSVAFEILSQTLLPRLVVRDRLVVANSRVGATQTGAQLAAPSVGSALFSMAGAGGVFAVQAAVSVCAAIFASGVGSVDQEARGAGAPIVRGTSWKSWFGDMASGLRYVFGQQALRTLTVFSGAVNLASGGFQAVFVLLLINVLGTPSSLVGTVVGVGAAGGILGVSLSGVLHTRVGGVPTLRLAFASLAAGAGLLGASVELDNLAAFYVGYFMFNGGIGVFSIVSMSYRQAVCPPEMMGRMVGSTRMISWGMSPVGALIVGLVGSWVGVAHVSIGVTAALAAIAVLAFVRVRAFGSLG